MTEKLKLMCILAHPDDESLGTGGILAKYADQGVETHLVTATQGERGWFGDPDAYPGPEALAEQDIFCLPGTVIELPGYFRISLTATEEMIDRALPGFAAAMEQAQELAGARR